MATTGYVDVSVVSSGNIKLRYKWTAGTQNIANNYTPVNWVLQLISLNSSASINSSASKSYSVTTNGSTTSGTNTVGISGGATKTLASGSLNIAHNSDGTKTFNFSFSQEFNITYSGASIGTITGSGSGTLNTIPRASILGTISNFTIGNSITIPITKYSSSFSDTLNIYVGDTWIKRVEGLVNNQSVSFTTAELNNIYAAMPNVTSAVFKFVNSTYSGPTVIGTSTKTATGTIASTIKPSISNIAITEAVSGIASQFGVFIQNKSQANVNVTYTLGTGSSLSSISIKLNGETFSTNNCTTNALTTSGTNTCTVVVTDSRGRSATSSQTISVTAYTSPTITSLTVVRCTADGTPDEMGDYAKVNGAATITALSNDNTKTFSLQYKQSDSSTWTTVETYNSSYTYTITNKIVSNVSADYPYDFRIVATDYFGDVSKTFSLESGFSIIDLRSTGKGIAFGKVSERNAMEINMPIYDQYDTQILNGMSIYSGGQVDPNTSIEELILTQTNTPESGFWYIKTMFYSTKSTTANRTQIAYPYNQTGKRTYIRSYYNGTWSSWQAANEVTNATANYVGNSLIGSDLSIQWGTVTVTPVANTPTNQTINFGRTYEKAPIVLPVAATGVIGTGVLGVAIVSSTTTQATVSITRINTVSTAIHFVVIGKVV